MQCVGVAGEPCRTLGGRRTLAHPGQEEVPCGFGLRTGDCSDTADGAGTAGDLPAEHRSLGETKGRSEPGLLGFFPLKCDTSDWPDWAKWGGGRQDCVCLWAFKGSGT